MGTSETIHATCVARNGRAILLRGEPGSGKSDLAFRFLSGVPGAQLIADDEVIVSAAANELTASAPPALAGLLEVRGLGLMPVTAADSASVKLVVDLAATPSEVPRIAEPRAFHICGISIPAIPLWPFAASAPQVLALALESIGAAGFPGDDGRLLSVPEGFPESLALRREPPHDADD